MKINIPTIDALPTAAQQFAADVVQKNRATVIAFYGAMGAGKTTFIKELCRSLGSEDNITSPTFSLVNEYTDAEGRPILHFDFYRIENLQEALDIGCDDYFYSGNLCLIEWPELIEDLLPEETLKVTIKEETDGSRSLEY